MAKKRGLGKGLDALLGPNVGSDLAAPDKDGELRHIPIDLLQRSSYQPRREFDKDGLEELAESIRQQGVVQPIVVRPMAGSGKFEIIAGERRWRAAQLAALHNLPAVVRQLDDKTTLCLALIENIQREDLSPLDEAGALSRLQSEFKLTHEQVAQAVGRSRASVTNMLRLLELTPKVKTLLQQGKLEMGHARALLALPADKQMAAATQVVNKGLTVRATEALVKSLQGGGNKNKGGSDKGRDDDPDIQRLATELAEQLGAETAIRHQKSGKGVLHIRYSSLRQLDGILTRIRG